MHTVSDCGILLRGYAKEEPEVKDVVERLHRSAMRAEELGFGRIIILIPEDKDCGKTYDALSAKLPNDEFKNIFTECSRGNGHSDALNAGVEFLRKSHHSPLFIVSNKALEYMVPKNIEKILAAFNEGALVAGLAIRDADVAEGEDEGYLGVLSGRISNTFAAWDTAALHAAGNFDSVIGVEEIAPIVRLIKAHGSCVAPLLPIDQAEINVSALRAKHHDFVVTTKRTRQEQEAERAGGSFEFIEQGILSGYPK